MYWPAFYRGTELVEFTNKSQMWVYSGGWECGPAMDVYQCKGKGSCGCSIHEGGCLSWSFLCWNPENYILIQRRNTAGINQGTCHREWGLADKEQKLPSPRSSYVCCYRKVWPTFRVSLPISNDSITKLPHRCAQMLGFSWFQM